MTVKELIERLETFPEDMKIYVRGCDQDTASTIENISFDNGVMYLQDGTQEKVIIIEGEK